MDDAVRQALFEGRAGRAEAAASFGIEVDANMHAKLWDNPCWFSYRLNYLALQFNNPVYGHIQQHLGLLRPEFVVLWSLYLSGDSTLTDVVRSSGFPKNTLSRAANKILGLGLIERHANNEDQRRITLHLTDKGRDAVRAVKAMMIEHERRMLEELSPSERLCLSEIMTKLVAASSRWPQVLEGE